LLHAEPVQAAGEARSTVGDFGVAATALAGDDAEIEGGFMVFFVFDSIIPRRFGMTAAS